MQILRQFICSIFFKHLFIIIIIISTSQVCAHVLYKIAVTQEVNQSNNIDPVQRKIIFEQLFDDMKFIFQQPDFYGVVGGLMLTPKLFAQLFKQESPEFTELWGNSKFADTFFEMGEIIGDGKFSYASSAILWSAGKIVNSESMKSFGTDLFRAQTLNGIFTIGIKGAINRQRPDGSPYAYPSGHTSSAFATAGVVYRHYGKNWGISAFILASYVGLSRLQENKHYFTDIIAGGIIGSYISLKVIKTDNQIQSLSISPYMNDKSSGLRFSLKF